MVRRAVFVLICFNLEHRSGLQILLVNLINLFTCVYYGHIKPFDTNFKTLIDMFNELCITVITWHIMLFTEWIDNPYSQYNAGWSMIVWICVNALVNICVVFWFVGRSIYLVSLKYYRIIHNKLYPKQRSRALANKESPEVLNTLSNVFQ